MNAFCYFYTTLIKSLVLLFLMCDLFVISSPTDSVNFQRSWREHHDCTGGEAVIFLPHVRPWGESSQYFTVCSTTCSFQICRWTRCQCESCVIQENTFNVEHWTNEARLPVSQIMLLIWTLDILWECIYAYHSVVLNYMEYIHVVLCE